MLVSDDEIIILVEGVILSKLAKNQLDHAVVAFLAHYYLLDLTYPPRWEIALTILQFLIFTDLQASPSSMSAVNELWQKLQDFGV